MDYNTVRKRWTPARNRMNGLPRTEQEWQIECALADYCNAWNLIPVQDIERIRAARVDIGRRHEQVAELKRAREARKAAHERALETQAMIKQAKTEGPSRYINPQQRIAEALATLKAGDWRDSVFNYYVDLEENKTMVVSSRAVGQVAEKLDEALVAREVQRQLASYDSYGEDAFEPGTVLRFTLTTEDSDEEYVFAAVKTVKNRKQWWHLTDGSHLTWDQLKRLLSKADPNPALTELVEKPVVLESAK